METAKNPGCRATKDAILSMIAERPYSVQQITRSFSSRSYEVIRLLSDMVRSGQIMVKSTDAGLFVVGGHTHH